MMAINYFQIRQQEIQSMMNKEDNMNRYKRMLNQMYQDMENDIQKEIDRYLARYARATNQTEAEAAENVSRQDLREYAALVEQYRLNQSPQALQQLIVLYPSLQITQLELTKAKINVLTVAKAKNEIEALSNKLVTDYQDEYQRRLSQMGDYIDTTASTKHINRLSEEATKQRMYGQHFSDRVWKSESQTSNELQDELDNVIRRSISLGENPVQNTQKLQEFVRDEVNKKAYAARRLAHTETQNVFFKASERMFEEHLENEDDKMIPTYDWLAEDDEKTCDYCKPLGEGGPYLLETIKKIKIPHPHCRCSWTISEEYLAHRRRTML